MVLNLNSYSPEYSEFLIHTNKLVQGEALEMNAEIKLIYYESSCYISD